MTLTKLVVIGLCMLMLLINISAMKRVTDLRRHELSLEMSVAVSEAETSAALKQRHDLTDNPIGLESIFSVSVSLPVLQATLAESVEVLATKEGLLLKEVRFAEPLRHLAFPISGIVIAGDSTLPHFVAFLRSLSAERNPIAISRIQLNTATGRYKRVQFICNLEQRKIDVTLDHQRNGRDRDR